MVGIGRLRMNMSRGKERTAKTAVRRISVDYVLVGVGVTVVALIVAYFWSEDDTKW